MEEQFEVIMQSTQRFSLSGCPVYLEKAAILKNYAGDKFFAQLEFMNTGNKNIIGLYITVKCVDTREESAESLKPQAYLDLNISDDEVFGSQILICLGERIPEDFFVRIDKIVYQENDIWENEKEEYMQEGSTQNDTSVNSEGVTQYPLDIDRTENLKESVEKDIQLVGSKVQLESVKKQQEEEKLKREQTERYDKIVEAGAKKIGIGLLVFIGFMIIVSMSLTATSTTKDKNTVEHKYERAVRYVNENRYEDARRILTELDGYKDSQTILDSLDELIAEFNQEQLYKSAKEKLEDGYYLEAYECFEEILDYKDSSSLKEIAKISYKDELCERIGISIEYRDFQSAQNFIGKLEGLEFLQEAEEQTKILESSAYEYANELMRKKEYGKAKKIFNLIPDYMDSKERGSQCLHIVQDQYIKTSPISSGSSDVYIVLQDGTVSNNQSNPSGWGKQVNKTLKKYRDVASIHTDKLGLELVIIKKNGKCDYIDVRENKVYKDYKNWSDLDQAVIGTFGNLAIAALRKDGTVVEDSTSPNYRGDLNSATKWTDVVYLAMGSGKLLVGVKSDGTVVYTGNKKLREAANKTSTWTDIVKVFVSPDDKSVFGITVTGDVVVSGARSGGVQDVVDIAFTKKDVYYLYKDGTVGKKLSSYRYPLSGRDNAIFIGVTESPKETVIYGVEKDGTIISDEVDMWNWNNKKALIK